MGMTKHASGTNSVYGDYERNAQSFVNDGSDDSGTAARFFFNADYYNLRAAFYTAGNSERFRQRPAFHRCRNLDSHTDSATRSTIDAHP